MKPPPWYRAGPCKDPLHLWYVERYGSGLVARRYFSTPEVAKHVASELRKGRLDFDADNDFERLH